MDDLNEQWWAETARVVERSDPRSIQTAEQRENERWWTETTQWLKRYDDERTADEIEDLCASYTDWRGFPLPGFESPRFLNDRERAYRDWYRSERGAQTRARREERGY